MDEDDDLSDEDRAKMAGSARAMADSLRRVSAALESVRLEFADVLFRARRDEVGSRSAAVVAEALKRHSRGV